MKKPYTIHINQYITEKENDLLDIIDDDKRIMLIANPGTGKTTFSSRLKDLQKKNGNRFVYATFLTAIPQQLQTEFDFDLVCSSYETEWTKRIDESKSLANLLKPTNNLLKDEELVIGTTLHQLTRFIEELTKDDVIVIDEAHQLVQLAHQSQIQSLRDNLKKTQAKLLLMTGTPFDGEAKRLKLSTVNIIEANPRVDKLIYLPITDSLKDKTDILDLTATLVHWYLFQDDVYNDETGHTLLNADTKKVLIFNNSSKVDNEGLSNYLFEEYQFKFDNINADKKKEPWYQYLITNQKIRDEVNGIITTSVIKEGINIKNQDIEVIILLGPLTLRDEKQIAKRIRGDKPLKIFRIYNELTPEQQEEIEAEIQLVTILIKAFKRRPDRLHKTLQRLANCGEILKSTGILDSQAKNINEVKTLDIIEQLEAKSATLNELIGRQAYNDLEAVDGFEYLEEKYDLFFDKHDSIGDHGEFIQVHSTIAGNERNDELKEILLKIFGSGKHFGTAINLLKCDLIGYSSSGKLLREFDMTVVSSIETDDYENPKIEDDYYDGMDDSEVEDAILEAVKIFSSKFRNEMTASVKILHFLLKYATDKSNVLPIFNEVIKPLSLKWNAHRFELADKLFPLAQKYDNFKKSKKTTSSGARLRVALTKDDQIIMYDIIKQIFTHVEKYSHVHLTLLKEYVKKKHGADQYMKSLKLSQPSELSMYVQALGVVDVRNSWKRSKKNKKEFDKLWKDAGKPGVPTNRSSLRVYSLTRCTPSELIDYYYTGIP